LIKLLIADDHPFYAQGVQLSLSDTDITVIGHITKIDEIIESYIALRPDVLLCDIMFGEDKTGLDVLQELLKKEPGANVILLSQYDQDNMIKQSYRLGAKAFLSKDVTRDGLIPAIETVARGELYFTPENALKLAKMTFDRAVDERPLEEVLTSKEIEVMTLLSDGYTEKEIATKFDVSVKTVGNTKAAIKEKLKVERTSSLTKLALKHGLINMDDVN